MRFIAIALVIVLGCSKSEPKLGFVVDMRLVQVCMLTTSFRQQLDAQRSQVEFDRQAFFKAVREGRPSFEVANAVLDRDLRGVANTRMMMNQTIHSIAFRDERLAKLAQLAHDLGISPIPAPISSAIEAEAHASDAVFDKAMERQHQEDLAVEAECLRVLKPYEEQ